MSNIVEHRIGLLVFSWYGHYTHYARLLLEALQPYGSVTIIGPKAALTSKEFTCSFKDVKTSLKFEFIELKEAQAVCHFVRTGKYDMLFSNELDVYWLKLLPYLLWMKMTGQMKTQICGILISCAFAYPENRFFSYKSFRCFFLKNIAPIIYKRIFIIDEIAFKMLQLENNKTFHLLEDPVETPPTLSQDELRKKIGWNLHDRILLVIGVIIPVKRIDLLLHAFLSSKPSVNQKLIIAGSFIKGLYDDFSVICQSSDYRENVVLEDRWLTDDEITTYISAADYIAVTYPNHFSNASILFRAMKAGKMTLLSNQGWIGRYSTIHKCGLACPVESAEDFQKSVKLLFSLEQSQKPKPPSWHNENTFIKDIQKNLFD